MKNTGRHSEKSGYLVLLLSVVGLTAFSHSMKELTEIQQLTVDASRVVAQWSGNFTPSEIPQIPQAPQVAVKIEKLKSSCQSKQSVPSVELRQTKPLRIERRVVTTIPNEAEMAAKLKKLRRIDVDADAFKINPRDREILLKTLNRSINLRIAS